MNTLAGADKKILIVDNELHIRMLLSQALRGLAKEGVTILSAEDGISALKIIERDRPNLVFLDLMMPTMHGFDVCRLIKSDYQMKDTFIVILSARNQSVDKQMGSIVGADEYIVKPFNPIKVMYRAREILGLPAPVPSNGTPTIQVNHSVSTHP